MYYCNNCSLKFDTPKKITETHSLHSPPYDYFYVCPLCNSSSFYEKKVTHCRCCGAKLKTEGTEYCSDACRKKGEKYWLKQKLRNEAELESPINKIIADAIVIKNKPIGLNNISVYPKNIGTAPKNRANVNSPKAKPLLLLKILVNVVNVIGIVILNNKTAKIPQILL